MVKEADAPAAALAPMVQLAARCPGERLISSLLLRFSYLVRLAMQGAPRPLDPPAEQAIGIGLDVFAPIQCRRRRIEIDATQANRPALGGQMAGCIDPAAGENPIRLSVNAADDRLPAPLPPRRTGGDFLQPALHPRRQRPVALVSLPPHECNQWHRHISRQPEPGRTAP